MDLEDLRYKLISLKDEHRTLEMEIEAAMRQPNPDFINLQRLKKRKLQLKDLISQIESKLVPEIIA